MNYFANAGYDAGTIAINYANKEKDSLRLLENFSGPITGMIFKSGGYVKKPIHVMQIENLGKVVNIEKCNNFKD